eukprot:TRINITY_DN19428_c0_g1_i1.p1 TRINITY_DN19428_c0_g1~~TRINITY_DN19428_c0_g1_i1.p1  ORF type:complete len:451 (+),score=57.86 TRINITY_DN19428_c0_g1_i1:61-1413(+)
MSAPFGGNGKDIKLKPGEGVVQTDSVLPYSFCPDSISADLAGLDDAIEDMKLTTREGKQVNKDFLANKSIILTHPVKPEVVLGEGSWYDELIDTETYTMTFKLRCHNPFISMEDEEVCGFSFLKHIADIENTFSFLDVAEEEDKTTESYVQMSRYLLAGGKVRVAAETEPTDEPVRMPRLLKENTDEFRKANDETARVLPFEDENQKTGKVVMRYLMLPETDDWYEVEHRNFMKSRVRIEMKDTAKYCVYLFYLSLLEFCFGWIILGVGTLQLDGGSEAVVIASFTSGLVMAMSSVLGFLGSLSAHENFIQRYMVSTLLTMSFLTTYLYVEISFLNQSELEFGTTDLASDGGGKSASSGASSKRSEIVLSLIFAAIALGITFLSTYTCTQALDSINDLGTLQDDALIFRYFQVRFTELKKQVEHLAMSSTGEYRSMTRTDVSPAVKAGDF